MSNNFGSPAYRATANAAAQAACVVPLNCAAAATAANSGADCAPLFLVHDVTGEVAKFASFARSRAQPCFGLQLTIHAPVGDMEKLAAWYLEAICAAVQREDNDQATMCIDLGGYSVGARVACCMAAQLLMSPSVGRRVAIRKLLCFEEGPSAPVTATTEPGACLLAGLTFVVAVTAPPAVLAQATAWLMDPTVPLAQVVEWVQSLPADTCLAPALRIQLQGSSSSSNSWPLGLVERVTLRLWFARTAARGNLLHHTMTPVPHFAATALQEIRLVRVSPAPRAAFLQHLGMLADTGSTLLLAPEQPAGHSCHVQASLAEAPDYGLAAAFPGCLTIVVVEVPGEHNTVFDQLLDNVF